MYMYYRPSNEEEIIPLPPPNQGECCYGCYKLNIAVKAKQLFINTIFTYTSIIYQKKRRKRVSNEWNSLLIVGDDENDIS